jgi:hypothetical protein
VLSGVFYINMGEVFYQKAGKEMPAHRPTDITFVNPADDPRKK